MGTAVLGRGKLQSISVHYINRGAGRDASIKVLGKDDDKMAYRRGGRGRDR